MNTNCGRGLVLIRALWGKSPCICSSASLLSSSSTIYLLHRLLPSRYVTAQLCPFITSLQLSLHNFSHNSTSALLTNCLLLPFFFFIPFDCFFPGVFSSCKSLCLLPFITQPSPLSALLALSRPLLPPTLPFHLPAPVHLVDAFIQSACFELTLYEYCNRSENRPYMYYSFFFVVVADFSLKRHQSARRKYFFLPLSEPVTISKGADLSMHSEKAAWLNFNGLCFGEGENEKTKPGYLHTYFNFSNVMQMQNHFQHVKTKQKVKSVQSISMIRWKLTSIDMPEKKYSLIYP